MVKRLPRPEYPRPQFERNQWLNLNGIWTYQFDFGKSGMDEGRQLYKSKGFETEITVPFCPESKLSGVGHTDFIEAMWYHRKITVSEEWRGKRCILNFGAVDYEAEVFIDGKSVGIHFGGTISFSFDITKYIDYDREHDLVIRVEDDVRSPSQPGGKQCDKFKPTGTLYTRTTGIWQTVWLEAVGQLGFKNVNIVSDFDGGALIFTPVFYEEKQGMTFSTTVKAAGKIIAEIKVMATSGVPVIAKLTDIRPWSMKTPFLYDIEFEVGDDIVKSYAGLRKIHIEDNQVYLNNKKIYQRLVLDQGFYPDGIWTAPNDKALKNDILLSQQAGFNGARLHQKVFEERFHYWADKLGYITWGESASWGCDYNSIEGARNFISEWQEIVMRDRNHPSIIAWTPWNESYSYTDPNQHTRVHIDTYNICKALDPTRPVNDASGYLHHITDIWTVHKYQQNPDKFREELTPCLEKGLFRNYPAIEPDYEGQPYIIDEYGGIKWIPTEDRVFANNSWGYGEAPKTLEEFYERLEKLTNVILEFDHMCGYCYTQLTDVEQEQNGIYNYDRTEKFNMSRVRTIFKKNPAGWE